MWQTVQKKGKNKNSQRKDAPKQAVQMGAPTNQQKQGSIPVPPTQPAKPNNKTNRVRDINNKGATKEGTDMDAFNDKAPTGDVNSVSIASDILNANSISSNISNNNDRNETIRKESLRNENVRTENTRNENVRNDNVRNDNSRNDNARTDNARTENARNDNANVERSTIKSEYKPMPLSKGKCVTDIVKDVPKPIKIPAPVESTDEPDRAIVSSEKPIQAKPETTVNKANVENDANADNKPQLPYKEGQWSPANPAGKKVYERDFLIALKEDAKSKMKPRDPIPDSVAVDLEKRVGDISRYPIGRTDFAPSFSGGNYAKTSSMRGSVGIGKRKSQQGSSGGNNKNSTKKVVSISLKEDVKLHETENAWKPARFIASENMTEDDKKTEVLYKRVRGILNKLTPQKFNILVNQVRDLSIDTTERLQGVIDLVFEKAVDEPNFSEAYASMCKELALMTVPIILPSSDDRNDEEREREKMEGKEQFINFRKLLVTRCQMEFEKNSMDDNEKAKRHKEIEECQDPEKQRELTLLLEEDERQIRKKSVGNIRFIGELFKQQMLTVNIMQRCLTNLLTYKDEENLECLCKLLTTVGYDLEVLKKVDLTPIFSQMKEIAHKSNPYKISSRVRFMLQDTIDLRTSKWIPRRLDNAPKTMDQIQKEAENEHLNIQALNSAPIATRKEERGNSGPTSERKGRRNANVTNDEGWTTQSRNSRTAAFSVQSDKLKNKPPQIDEPLGSNNIFCGWARGSNINKPQAPATNIYSCLDNNLESEKRMLGSRPSSSRDPYSSKGPSMERYNKFDGRGSRSGSQHRDSRDSRGEPRDSRETRDLRPSPALMPVSKMAPPSSNINSRSNSIPTPPEPQQERLELTDSQTTYILGRLNEYLCDCCTLDECYNEIIDHLPKAALPSVVEKIISCVLDQAKVQRLRTGKLFCVLISKALPLEDFCQNLETCVFSQANEWMLDMPKLWDYFADILYHVVCDYILPLSKLAKMLEPVEPAGKGIKLLEPLFKIFIEDKGPNFLLLMWQNSGCTLKDFIAEKEINAFVENNKLDFLLGSEVHPAIQSTISCEQMHDKLMDFFLHKENMDVVVNWIIANVGDKIKENQYIRTFATAIFEDSIRNFVYCPDILKNHYNLIVKFVDNNQILELQCLIALQRLVTKLEHPKGVLLAMFNDLYEDGIFSQDSFIQWQTATLDPSDLEGKGVAMKQLTMFYFNICQELSDGSDEA